MFRTDVRPAGRWHPALWGFLAVLLLITGCKGASMSGAAGNQVDHMGGSRGGMDRDSNGGGGY